MSSLEKWVLQQIRKRLQVRSSRRSRSCQASSGASVPSPVSIPTAKHSISSATKLSAVAGSPSSRHESTERPAFTNASSVRNESTERPTIATSSSVRYEFAACSFARRGPGTFGTPWFKQSYRFASKCEKTYTTDGPIIERHSMSRFHEGLL